MKLSSSKYKALASSHADRGFALLITITLLAFLVLLLVSLATLTRVETGVAGNNQNLAQARYNALMGLNVAIGQLQKFAGPDQRVTTTADAVSNSGPTGTIANPDAIPYAAVAYASMGGKHITIPPTTTATGTTPTQGSGSRYWTAVWGNGESAMNYSAGPNSIPPGIGNNKNRGVTPVLLNWLVSGNESASFSPNGTQGGVTAGTAPIFVPGSPSGVTNQGYIAGLTSTSAATDTNMTFSNIANAAYRYPAVLLVGPASAASYGPTGNSSASNITDGYIAGNFVAAPLVPITVPTSIIPGLVGSTPASTTTIGHYAYWVGDEGVKARVNQLTGYQKTQVAGAPDTTRQINEFITGQRSALEMMDYYTDPLNPANNLNIGTGGFSPTLANVSNTIATPQVSLLLNGTSVIAAKGRFHDLTTQGYGVLSDTYAGGLKKDLTADIADHNTGGDNLAGDRKLDTDLLFTQALGSNAGDPAIPRWSQIRNWARVNPQNPANPAQDVIDFSVPATATAAKAAGIFPNIIFSSLGMDYYAEPINPAITVDPVDPSTTIDIQTFRVNMAFYPMVVLQNPYPITLTGGTYDIIFRFGSQAQFRFEADSYTNKQANGSPNPIDPHTGQPKYDNNRVYRYLANVNLNTLQINALNPVPPLPDNTPPPASSPESFIRLRLILQPIPPGQRHMYVLNQDMQSGPYYTPGGNASSFTMTRAYFPSVGGSSGLYNKFIIKGDIITVNKLSPVNEGVQNFSRLRMLANTSTFAPPSNRVLNPASNPPPHVLTDFAATRLPYAQTSVLMTKPDAYTGTEPWGTPGVAGATVSGTATTSWYQGLYNIYPVLLNNGGNRGCFFTTIGFGGIISGYNPNGQPIWTFPPTPGQTDGDQLTIGDVFPKPLYVFPPTAFNVSPLLNGNGYFSGNGGGAPTGLIYATRYIASASFRAPLIQGSYEEIGRTLPSGATRPIGNKGGAFIMGSVITGAYTEYGTAYTGGKQNPVHPGIDATGKGYNRYSTMWSSSSPTGGGNPAGIVANQTTVILWDLLDSPDRLLSLGQLQHVPFSRYGFQPSYLFANSYADMRVPRNALYTSANISGAAAEVTPPGASSGFPLYDTSWLLNRALWDRYFVSGVPSTLAQADITKGTPLPNARMTYYSRTGTPPSLNNIQYSSGKNAAYDMAAANLLAAGSFNINSTSEQAWRAVLSGTYKITPPASASPNDPAYAYATQNDNVDAIIPYPRFTHNLTVLDPIGLYAPLAVTLRPDPVIATNPNITLSTTANGPLFFMSPDPTTIPAPSGSLEPNRWCGNRGLYLNSPAYLGNPSQSAVVKELARILVYEIRKRGPFLSLADFINRPLTNPNDPTNVNGALVNAWAGIKGALQAAIDNMGVKNELPPTIPTPPTLNTVGPSPTVVQVNPWMYHFSSLLLMTYPPASPVPPVYAWQTLPLSEHAQGGPHTDMVGQPPGYNTGNANFYPAESYRSKMAMGPKDLTQADILSTIGPTLSARSDTFTIRSYGETTDPKTGTTTGRAWCEAVVQRVPDYIDQSDPNIATLGNATPPSSLPVTSMNKLFGRRFTIVSFRWLSPKDI